MEKGFDEIKTCLTGEARVASGRDLSEAFWGHRLLPVLQKAGAPNPEWCRDLRLAGPSMQASGDGRPNDLRVIAVVPCLKPQMFSGGPPSWPAPKKKGGAFGSPGLPGRRDG